MLEQERKFFEENRALWLTKFPGRFVLIKGSELLGTFDTIDEALAEGARRFGLESFLARRVEQVEQEINIPALTLGILRANPTHPISRSGSDS
jgi:hypothetical protein